MKNRILMLSLGLFFVMLICVHIVKQRKSIVSTNEYKVLMNKQKKLSKILDDYKLKQMCYNTCFDDQKICTDFCLNCRRHFQDSSGYPEMPCVNNSETSKHFKYQSNDYDQK